MLVVDKDTNPATAFFTSEKFQNELKLVYKDDKYAVFENTTAYPRFNLMYHTYVVKNDMQALGILAHKTIDVRKNVLIEEPLPVALTEGTGTVKFLSSTLNTQQFAITTDKPALFYISDTYFPGWKAMVNNHETKIYRANYNFRAVLVPAGKSILEFSYIPSTFLLGVWISVISGIGLISIGMSHKKVYTVTTALLHKTYPIHQ